MSHVRVRACTGCLSITELTENGIERYMPVHGCVCTYVARREKPLQKVRGEIDLPRVRELAEFRWTRPDAASRSRRGRGQNIVRADARSTTTWEGMWKDCFYGLWVYIVRQRMRNYESNFSEKFYFYIIVFPALNVLPRNVVSKDFRASSKATGMFDVFLTGRHNILAYVGSADVASYAHYCVPAVPALLFWWSAKRAYYCRSD